MTRSKSFLKGLLGATALTVLAAPAFAQANNFTPAGEVVENTFTLSYTTGTATNTFTPPATTDFTVDRLVNVNVAGSSTTGILPGAQDQTVLFTVTNNGNDDQGYILELEQETGDDFDTSAPTSGTPIQYYLEDGDGNCANDASPTLTTYTAGASVPPAGLPADALLCVVVSQDISNTTVDTDEADVSLIAKTTTTGSTTEVTADTTNTIGGVENVLADTTGTFTGDAANDGDHSATSTYTVGAANIAATKEVFAVSTDGTGCGTTPASVPTTSPSGEFMVPGACVAYVIEVTNSGSQPATAVDIEDILPFEVSYASSATFGFSGTAPTPSNTPNSACRVVANGSNCDEVNITGGTVPANDGTNDGVGQLVIHALVN
jgi:uncharacterized repeat protein (TIGR01451 family)